MNYKKSSITDGECGIFHKGEHKRVLAYSANTACDKNNFILDFELSSGNTHDSQSFPNLYKRLANNYENMTYVVMDSGYRTPLIAKLIIDDNKIPVLPYKRPMTKDGFFKKYEYVYDEHYNCYICPANQVLNYSTTNRNGYHEYNSNPKFCKTCPHLSNCTDSKNNQKKVIRHVWQDYLDEVEQIRHTDGMKGLYKKRSQTIERVFADAKELHQMRYTRYRGLNRVKMEITLKFACMNLKKLALWIAKSAYMEFLTDLLWFISIKLNKKIKTAYILININCFCLHSERLT